MDIDDFLLREEEIEYKIEGDNWIWGVTGLRFISYRSNNKGEVTRFRDLNLDEISSLELDTNRESEETKKQSNILALIGAIIAGIGVLIRTQTDIGNISLIIILIGLLMVGGGLFSITNKVKRWKEYRLRVKGGGVLPSDGWKLDVKDKEEEEVRIFIRGVRRAIRKL